MFVPVSKSGLLNIQKSRSMVNKHVGSAILLNEIKKPTMGIVRGNGVVDYGGWVQMPRIRGLQTPESTYKRIKEEVENKAGLLKDKKTDLIKNMKDLKISGTKKMKKNINNLRFEL